MRRTYKSKKETAGAIDPRDVLLTLDAKSSVFDAFYIQNIKQTKKDMSVGSTMQFAASNKVRKRKYVKRLKEQEALFHPRESSSTTAFLTPDKSFRVNKPPDLFDQLLNSSSNKANSPEPVNLLRKQTTVQQKSYIKKNPSKKRINYSNSDSSDSDKENFSSSDKANKTANTSDIKSHKLIIEKETKSSPKYIDESINNIVNNLSIFTHIKNQTIITPENKYKNLRKHSLPLQNSPLCSTPFHEKYRGASIYRFSPINIENSPKCITDIEDGNDCADDTPTHKNDTINIENIDLKLNITEVTIKENIENTIETAVIINETNTTAASIIYESTDKTTNITEIQSPILPNRTMNSNRREPRKLPTFLSEIETTNMEPFHGFEDDDLLENSKVDAINYKYKELENYLADNSYTIPSHTQLSQDSSFVNSNRYIEENKKLNSESYTSSAAESTDSESFYDTCNSDNNIEEQVQNNKPIVVVEKLNDSIFDKYYSQMANYSAESNDLSTRSNSSVEVSESVSNKSSLSITSQNSIDDDNVYNVGDESNESINSNEINDNDNSIESKSEDVCVSFVTTRRRNEFNYDSFIGLDNSIASASSHEFDKTVLTNKNSLDSINDVIIEENIIDNMDDFLNKEPEEIDCNGAKYNFNESDKIAETELSEKFDKISTRKSIRESLKANKTKSIKHNKLPEIKDSAEDSLHIRSEEIDPYRFENKSTNNDERSEPELTSKANIILTRKSARASFKATKSKSQINNKALEFKQNPEDSLKMVTRRSSRIFRDSIAGVCQNPEEYDDSMGNESISYEKPGIILEPGKRWERSLSIYRRMTTMADNFDHSIMDVEQNKGRKYRQSVITTLEMQDLKGSFHNDSIHSRRSTFVSKPSRSTIKIVRESNTSRSSLCTTVVCEDLEGFLGEDCDDTIVELSKLSIAESEHEVTIIEKFHDTSNRRTTARDYVLRRCNQADVLPFDECYPDPVLKNCRKIGEGVYGEVFLWRAGDGRARVLKVIPIAGNVKVNGEQQKDFHEIISEIVIAMELSALRAPIADIEQHLNDGKSLETLDLHSVENATDVFNEVLRVRCVSGNYPSRLLELWELYDECRGSENDNPATLTHQQHYVVLELDNAGEDLESYHFTNAEQSYALFKQIAFGLAVAEEAYQFEHRDLHWGNVLISPTEEKFATFVVRGRLHRVRRGGVRAAVIDYSLSRATLGRCALYNDLAADDALFDALGDYQFQLYRLMRDKLGNDWKNFEPYTNILWLHYIVDKMITALRYTRTNTKIHKHYIEKLKGIKNRILNYGSAVQYVLTDNEL